jgi:CRP/FNR family transcriptional regulator, anaerobic regulatory protein
VSQQSSCLVTKLSHYVDISSGDRDHLAEIEKAERTYGAGKQVYQIGEANRELFVVKKGWLFSFTELADGRRQIVKLYLPGDIIGFPDVAMTSNTTTLATIEEATLCPFPKTALDTILRESPRLSALLLSIALRDQVVFIDLLRATGRMNAQERLAYLVLDLAARLRITNPGMTDTFRLPLNQSHIADYLGLTNVYISKTFRVMEEDGLLSRRSNMLRLLQEKTLAENCDFTDRYNRMDTSWFPDA